MLGVATVTTIQLENQKPGTPESVWQIPPGANSQLIQGFTTSISTNVGGTVNFKVNNQTGNANYQHRHLSVGLLRRRRSHTRHDASASGGERSYPARAFDRSFNWHGRRWQLVSYRFLDSPYNCDVRRLHRQRHRRFTNIPNPIHHSQRQLTSDIVFQTADETWQAYNPWGGANLYGGNGPGISGSAYAVSYNRPITTRDGGFPDTGMQRMLFGAEYSGDLLAGGEWLRCQLCVGH